MTTGDVLAERYALTRLLGRGGMGAVWAADDQVLGRPVAVKMLNVVHAPAGALERFRREARLLAGLAHPHIVTVFDYGADEERAWLVMELLPGPTLHELLSARGALPVDSVTTYGRQCASALSAAHALDVVHRDIKPANVMLAADGRCVVLDFGIARLAEPGGETVTALTETGMLVGTAAYVAPELVQGRPATPAVDTYALGAVLFTLLTGHPPFQAQTPLLTLAQHVQAAVPHPRAERPDTPASLDELVVALLAKDPGRRPTAAEVVRRLDELDVVPAEPSPTLLLPVQPARSRRRRVAAALALVAAVVLVAAVWALSTRGGDRAPAPPTAHQPSSSTAATTTTRAVSSTPPSTPSASTPQRPIDRLRAAVQQAEATGGLSGGLAQDFNRRVAALSSSVNARPRKDFAHQVNDFEHRLADARKHGQVSDSAYTQIEAALQALRGGSKGD